MKATQFFTMAALCVAVIITPACTGGGGGGGGGNGGGGGGNGGGNNNNNGGNNSSGVVSYAPDSFTRAVLTWVHPNTGNTLTYSLSSTDNKVECNGGSRLFHGTYTYKKLGENTVSIEVNMINTYLDKASAYSYTEYKDKFYLIFVSPNEADANINRWYHFYQKNYKETTETYTYNGRVTFKWSK